MMGCSRSKTRTHGNEITLSQTQSLKAYHGYAHPAPMTTMPTHWLQIMNWKISQLTSTGLSPNSLKLKKNQWLIQAWIFMIYQVPVRIRGKHVRSRCLHINHVPVQLTSADYVKSLFASVINSWFALAAIATKFNAPRLPCNILSWKLFIANFMRINNTIKNKQFSWKL